MNAPALPAVALHRRAFLSASLAGAGVPVSYTHLDVYKRQGAAWDNKVRNTGSMAGCRQAITAATGAASRSHHHRPPEGTASCAERKVASSGAKPIAKVPIGPIRRGVRAYLSINPARRDLSLIHI